MIRNIKRNIAKKKTAEYQRTSSGGQDLELQVGSNAEYLKTICKEDILPFIDFDVSATKLSIEERPALSRMLKLVKDGYIERVVCYDRDRIARNVYEYIYIVKIFYEYDVDVIFTATNAPPFSNDLFVETWYGLSAQFEGQRIKTRLSDALKRNPPSIIGYKKKVDSKTGHRIYVAIPDKKDKLFNLFKEFSEIQDREQIFEVIMKYQSLLKRNELRIIDILRTPFFSAHYEGLDGEYYDLPNVEPIIPLTLFKEVQMKLAEFDQGINQGLSLSKKEGNFNPYCGSCREELKFRKGKIGVAGSYYCSKHNKNKITVKELHESIADSVRVSIKRISYDRIGKITQSAIGKHIEQLKSTSLKLLNQLEDLCIKFSQSYKPDEDSPLVQKALKRINQVRDEVSITDSQIALLENLRNEVKLFVGFSETKFSNLDTKQVFDLADLLIASIYVYEDHIILNYYFNDFFIEGMQS